LIFKILAQFNKDNHVGVYCLSHDYNVKHNSVIEFDTIIELENRDGFTNLKEVKSNK
jgi:hypothetical protein